MKKCEVKEKNKILLKNLIKELDFLMEDEKLKLDIVAMLKEKLR